VTLNPRLLQAIVAVPNDRGVWSNGGLIVGRGKPKCSEYNLPQYNVFHDFGNGGGLVTGRRKPKCSEKSFPAQLFPPPWY